MFGKLMGGERFPGMKNIGDGASPEGLYQHVDVVGHDDKTVQDIAVAIKMAQRRSNRLGDCGIAQQTCSVASIQPIFPLIAEPGLIFVLGFGVPRFRVVFEPALVFFRPLPQKVLGDSVVRTEGDEVGRSRLGPMGEVPAGDGD